MSLHDLGDGRLEFTNGMTSDRPTDAEIVEKIRRVLSRTLVSDVCHCIRCEETIEKAQGWACETCGYTGKPVAISCQCYDTMCPGSGRNGAGCPHGALVCPVCDDGEIDVFALLREIRKTLE
jgi:hypothetical protein